MSMHRHVDGLDLLSITQAEYADDLKEARRFFEWALSYERKGLKIAADALRDEGRKALARFKSVGSRLA